MQPARAPLRFVSEQATSTRAQLRSLCQPPLLSHCIVALPLYLYLSVPPHRLKVNDV